MKESILIPLDGSTLAETALPHALALARLTGRSLTLLRVVPLPVAYSQILWGAPVPASIWGASGEEPKRASEYLATTASQCSQRPAQEGEPGRVNVEVHTQLLEGDPASTIVEYAEQHPLVTTIAMATHGRRGLDRWVFGSVAEKVLQASPVPLLLVRSSEADADAMAPLPARSLEEGTYGTIVVPLDGSYFAEMALEKAKRIAISSSARLILMSAVPENMAASDLLAPIEVQQLWDQQIKSRTTYLEEIGSRLRSEGVEADVRVICELPAEAILELCEREGADLIVMSTHGRGGLRRLWLGSVANDVVRRASQPVLLIRAKTQAAQPRPEPQKGELALKA
jgi:nucleotide-binding universal stress UspA family protein